MRLDGSEDGSKTGRWSGPARQAVVHGRSDGSTSRMAEYHNELYAQFCSRIFKASDFGLRSDTARYPHNKQFTWALIKDQLWTNTGVCAPEYGGKWCLAL